MNYETKKVLAIYYIVEEPIDTTKLHWEACGIVN